MYVDKEERPSGEVKSFSEIMNKAADLIRDKGHAKYTAYDGDKLCTWAAVVEAEIGGRANGLVKDSPYHHRLTNFLVRNFRVGICYYNNNNTTADVISMLRRAAKEA